MPFGRVQALEGAGLDELLAQAAILFLAAIAPNHVGGFSKGGHLPHPSDEFGVLDKARGIDI